MNMKRILSFWRVLLLVLLVSFALLAKEGQAAEKLNLGTSIKFTPAYYLPILAAEDKGFFKEQGLEVEWVPFTSGPPMHNAIVAGSIMIAPDTATGHLPAMTPGLPPPIFS